MYRLSFNKDFVQREPFCSDARSVAIGRDDTCQLQLVDKGVGNRHAVIERGADGYYVRDLDSATGVLVNGQKVTRQRLLSGDEIELGAARFRFEFVHVVPSRRRRMDAWQVLMALIVAVSLAGQVALLAWIVSEPHPAKVKRSQRGRASQSAQARVDEPPFEPGLPPPVSTTNAPTKPPAASPPTVLNRKIRIMSVVRQDTAEAVALTVRVMAQVGERQLDAGAMGVCVEAYVRTDAGGITPASPAPQWLDTSNWENFTARTFQVRLAVNPSRLAGYAVRTYYRNQLQDVATTPGLVPAESDSLR